MQKEIKIPNPSWLMHRAGGNPEWLKDEKRKKKKISRVQEVIFTPTPQVLCKGSGTNVHSGLEGDDYQSGVISLR